MPSIGLPGLGLEIHSGHGNALAWVGGLLKGTSHVIALVPPWPLCRLAIEVSGTHGGVEPAYDALKAFLLVGALHCCPLCQCQLDHVLCFDHWLGLADQSSLVDLAVVALQATSPQQSTLSSCLQAQKGFLLPPLHHQDGESPHCSSTAPLLWS